MRIDTLTVIGVGLLGGSVARAALARGVARRVIGLSRDREKLLAAHAAGVVTETADALAAGVKDADLVVVCTPVDRIADHVLAAGPHCKPGAVLTDVGSTKTNIARSVSGRLPPDVAFVGSHPMAGSEKAGAEYSRADLFDGRAVVVTPTLASPQFAVNTLDRFWTALGGKVIRLSPEEHDRAVAVTSHVPHAVAAALAGGLPRDLFPLAGAGFRDTTRIAAGDAALWAAIFRANKDAVLTGLARVSDRLDEFRRLLRAGDGPGLVRWLSDGKQVRDALGS